MTFYKVSSEKELVPVDNIHDVISENNVDMFYLVDDKFAHVRQYPLTGLPEDVQNISIGKNGSAIAKLDILTDTQHKYTNLDTKRYSPAHFELLRKYHNERLSNKVMKIISAEGFIIYPRDTILRVLTEDKKTYILYKGVIFSVGLALRIAKIIGNVPNPKIIDIQVGDFKSKTINFTFEKHTVKTKDLHF
jgi:hypothetical protein